MFGQPAQLYPHQIMLYNVFLQLWVRLLGEDINISEIKYLCAIIWEKIYEELNNFTKDEYAKNIYKRKVHKRSAIYSSVEIKNFVLRKT